MSLNQNQVKLRYGKKLDGTPVYGHLGELVGGKLPVIDTIATSFNLSADADVKALDGTTEFPLRAVYVDGSTFEAVDGGIASSTVGAIGTADLAHTLVGGRIVNLVRLLNAENDEVVVNTQPDGEVRDAKLVYAMVQTTANDGEATDATNLQLSFVVLDDETGEFKPWTLEAGDYKFQPTRMYTVGTASKADKLSAYLTGKAIGGFALDEILTLTSGGHGESNFVFTEELTPTSTIVKVKFTGETTAELSVDDTVIATLTQDQDVRKTFDAVNFGKYVSSEEVKVNFNGIKISPRATSIVDKDTMTFDIANAVANTDTFEFYIDDEINIEW